MMWPASQRFFDTIVRSHTVLTKLEVLVGGVVAYTIEGVKTVDPNTGARAASIDGTVQVRRAFVRRSANVTVLDVDGRLTPTEASDVFAILRNEIRLYRGVQYWDATYAEKQNGTDREWVPIFTGAIGRAQIHYPLIQLECYDRLWALRGRLPRQMSISAGTVTTEALLILLSNIVPGAQQDFDIPTLEYLTPTLIYDAQTDASTVATDLASACGLTLFCTPFGTITAKPETIATPDQVVWSYKPGITSTMGEPDRDIDGTQAENAVMATNDVDGVAGAFAGYAEDTNPASLTYVGVVPRVTRFFSSPLLQNNAQCALAAQTILARELGVADTVVLPIFGNPAHESTDVIALVSPLESIDGLLVLDEFDVPISNGTMTLNCRTQVI